MQSSHRWRFLQGLTIMTLTLVPLPSRAQDVIICDGVKFTSISSILQAPPSNNIIVDDRSGACSPIISPVTLKGINAKLLLGPRDYTFSGSVTFDGTFVVEGERNFTNLMVPPAASGAAFVTLGSPYFALRGLTVNGNDVGSQLINVPSSGAFNSNARAVFDHLLIQGFPASPTPIMNLAANLAWVEFTHSFSTDNQATTIFGWGNLLFMEDDHVYSPDSFPGIWSQGGQVTVIGGDYQALTTNAGASAPDFLLQPISGYDVGAGAGGGFFQYVRFGPESESATHVRIKVAGTAPTNVLIGLRIENCSFGVLGSVSQPTAPIEFDTPVSNAIISGNSFLNYPTFINDAYAPIFLSQDNVFTKTNIMAQGQGNFRGVCVNGCVAFSNVENLGIATLGNLESWQSTNWSHEQNSVRNLIVNSEVSATWRKDNVKITAGQADPYGTSRAVLLHGIQANANQQAILSFLPPKNVSTIFFSIWAKAGTASLMSVNLFKSLNQNLISAHAFLLTNACQQYYAVYTWDPTSTSGKFVIFIANPQTPQTIYVFGPEASSSQPSDYVPTDAFPITRADAGLRFERNLLFGQSSHLMSPALTTPTVNGSNPAVLYAPTTATLAAKINLKPQTAATVLSSSLTMPSTGGPFHVLTNYAMYWDTPKQSGMRCEGWVADGASAWAASENQNSQSAGQSGNSSSGISPVAYTNGATVTLTLKVLCDKAGTITVSPPQAGPPKTYLQSVVVAAAN